MESSWWMRTMAWARRGATGSCTILGHFWAASLKGMVSVTTRRCRGEFATRSTAGPESTAWVQQALTLRAPCWTMTPAASQGGSRPWWSSCHQPHQRILNHHHRFQHIPNTQRNLVLVQNIRLRCCVVQNPAQYRIPKSQFLPNRCRHLAQVMQHEPW